MAGQHNSLFFVRRLRRFAQRRKRIFITFCENLRNLRTKNLLPPLTDAEFTGLEESILKDGCLSPLVIWNDILVDGHHRYEIFHCHSPYFIRFYWNNCDSFVTKQAAKKANRNQLSFTV
jgi:hypothetical protein